MDGLTNTMKFLMFAVFAAALLGCAPAWAHRTSTGETTGISIPSLTHGQMAVIAQYRREILTLADRQTARSDETFFRLRNYVDLQYLYCAWGLVPGSVTDEASPFNECSHAYLSGARALLLYMQTMPGDQTAVHALVDRIERDMLANNASLVLCQYSNEAFNTADHISPNWRDVPFHGPTVMTLAGVAGVFLLGAIGGGRLLRRVSA
jgi:hypothetical protein